MDNLTDSIISSDISKEVLEKNNEKDQNRWFQSSQTAYSVIDSRFVKTPTHRGEEEAAGQLSVREVSDTDRSKGLFRWIHFQHSEMNYEAFLESASQIPHLSETQRSSVVEFLTTVRKQYQKDLPSQHGLSGKSLQPHVVRQSSARGTEFQTGKRNSISHLCFPYFCLDRYGMSKPAGKSILHPMRPLLQSYFSSAKKEQDLQQAICNLPDTPKDHCWNVAQLWCLVVNTDLLLTCSRHHVEEISRDILGIQTLPSASQSAIQKESVTKIKVFQEDAKILWLLPLQECETFLETAGFFWETEMSLQKLGLQLSMTSGGRPVTPENWIKVLEPLKRSNTRINLGIKSCHASL
jgi:hypothetical protein